MKISKIINPILDFFFPDACIICGEDTDGRNLSVCRKCLNKIEYIKPPYCQTCYQPLPDGGAHCWQCRKTKYHFEKIIAVGKYTGILRELILRFKEKEFLKVSLGNLLLETVRKNMNIIDNVDIVDIIVAVPLSKKKEFNRGYNQSQLLAEFLGKNLNKKVISNNLIRIKETKPQFELTREERLANLKDAFSVKDPIVFKGKNIAIVDDVTTTCSSLEECSKILKKSGAKKVFCLVLARD